MLRDNISLVEDNISLTGVLFLRLWTAFVGETSIPDFEISVGRLVFKSLSITTLCFAIDVSSENNSSPVVFRFRCNVSSPVSCSFDRFLLVGDEKLLSDTTERISASMQLLESLLIDAESKPPCDESERSLGAGDVSEREMKSLS